jgi:VanZ family protein
LKKKTVEKFEAQGREKKSWLWVLLCTAVIFFTIPVARSIQEFVYDSYGREYFTYTAIAAIATVLFALLYLLIFRFRVRSFSQYVWLFAVSGVSLYFVYTLRKYPVEAIHLLEYGLLAYLVFKALCHKVRDRTIYIDTVLIVLIIGAVDEYLQWLIPTRVGSYKDVAINAMAGLLSIIAVSQIIKPPIINQPVSMNSLSILGKILFLALITVVICLIVLRSN